MEGRTEQTVHDLASRRRAGVLHRRPARRRSRTRLRPETTGRAWSARCTLCQAYERMIWRNAREFRDAGGRSEPS